MKHDCLPRSVYEQHLGELIELIKLPGKAFRITVNDKITIPSDAMEIAGPHGAPNGLDPKKFLGVVDDAKASFKGKWTKGQGLKPYFLMAISTQVTRQVPQFYIGSSECRTIRHANCLSTSSQQGEICSG